jgi:hypothetical protein
MTRLRRPLRPKEGAEVKCVRACVRAYVRACVRVFGSEQGSCWRGHIYKYTKYIYILNRLYMFTKYIYILKRLYIYNMCVRVCVCVCVCVSLSLCMLNRSGMRWSFACFRTRVQGLFRHWMSRCCLCQYLYFCTSKACILLLYQ